MNMLSPLPGKVCTLYIQCGKANCRCEQGDLHGPYNYRVWREGNKIHKAYVKQEDIGTVQAQCEVYQTIQTRLRQIRLEQRDLAKHIARERRVTKRLLRHQKLGASVGAHKCNTR